MATLSVPPMLSSPRDDAMELYRAFKGFRCDAGKIVNILAHRDAMQRLYIDQEYRTMYSEELTSRLSSELSGDLKKAVLLWMPDPATRDAIILRHALCESGNLKVVTEVICSRTPSQIQHLKQLYVQRFQTRLEHDVEREASGDHKKMLLAYINMMRYEGPEVVDNCMAEYDAKTLYKAGEKKLLGTDEKTFIRIFSEKSRIQLAGIASAYHSKYKKSLKKAIKSETSGLFEFALLTILQCALNPGKYFAKVMHKAMKGMGTDETTLSRIIVTRTEMDMQYIIMEYQKTYGKLLNDVVRKETSGNYRTFLLALLGPSV